MMQLPRLLFFVDAAGHLTRGHVEQLQRETGRPCESRHIWHVLGLRDEDTRQKLAAAVRRAATERRRAVLVVGRNPGERSMITIRPAREAGMAAITCDDMVAAVSLLDNGALVDLFALSPAEADIAVMLGQGLTLAEVAERRLVQQETVRGQVKVLLRKIGVANQKQLAAVLAQVGAALMDVRISEGVPAARALQLAATG